MISININNQISSLYIRMISEGLCDTEVRSNDAENSSCITGTKLQLKMCSTYYLKKNIYIFQFFCILGEKTSFKNIT